MAEQVARAWFADFSRIDVITHQLRHAGRKGFAKAG